MKATNIKKRTRFSLLYALTLVALATGVGQQQASADGSGNADVVSGAACMQDTAGFGLQCTANDVSLATATNIVIHDACELPGDTTTFTAQFEVLLTAQGRHDVGIWWASDGDPNADGALTGTCTVATPPYAPDPPWLDLDGDQDPLPGENTPSGIQDTCGDIDDDHNPLFPEVTFVDIVCADPDGDGFLNLPYCTSWRQPGDNDLCISPLDAVPGAPSKCNCEPGFNVDIPVPFTGTIEVIKDLDPSSDPGTFNLNIDGVAYLNGAANPGTGAGNTGTTGAIIVSAGISTDPTPIGDTHMVSETGFGATDLSKYDTSISCTDGIDSVGPTAGTGPVNLFVEPNDAWVCTITNERRPATLTLVKEVVNDDGGTALITDWNLSASGPTPISGDGGVGPSEVAIGTYTLSESTGPDGYTASSWVCTGGGSQNGNQITLDSDDNVTCTITNDDIAPTLTLIKTVVNDDGGTLGVGDFPLFISGNPATSGNAVTLSAGSYVASETEQFGYAAGDWGGDCDAAGNVTLALAENKTCTITNDDIAPTLTLIKTVTNDNGGTLGVGDFPLFISDTPTDSGVAATLTAGDYLASETTQFGYAPGPWTGDCDAGGNVSLSVGENKTCTINNDDIAPTLTLIKTVTNDNGGTLDVGDFPLFISDTPTDSGVAATLTAGDYLASETTQFGYAPGPWTGDCDAGGNVSLSVGENKTCTINNDDIAPTLTLIKTVTNDNGGTLDVGDFPLFISDTPTDSGVAATLTAGDYLASETTQFGYAPGPWTGDCDAGGNVSLSVGENKTCTINNDDIAPTLTLIKTVTNDNGGTLDVGDFPLFISDTPTDSGVAATLTAGDYLASETTQFGYAPGPWTGDCDAGGNVSLSVGENKTCTINNDDIAPTLTLIKTVTNDNGGTLDVGDFPLFISDTPTDSGVAATLTAGDYLASETTQFGYAPGPWTGDCDAGGNVSLSVGENKTCTINNDDIAPTLTLIKTVTNDNGGTLDVGDFPLFISDTPTDSGVAATLTAGDYLASETTQFGYAPGPWTGDCDASGNVSLSVGENKTCTINNDDIAPTLTLIKTVTNDNGGTLGVGDFPLFISDTPTDSGVAATLTAGDYLASETTQFGYAPGPWTGDCDAGGNVSLSVGENKTCTINNDDIAPTLTLIKTVTNDNGGTLDVGDFPLFISGTPTDSGVAVTLSAGNYTATEDQQTGYTASAWGTDCAADATVMLGVGESKTCTINNDDIAPTLTLIKTVTNNNGGTLGVGDFPLFISGTPTDSGVAATLSAGDYVASETTQFGYAPGPWTGDCDASGNVSLSVGESKTCTINNDDIAPTLTLIKTVTNNNGGTLGVGDFPLFIDNSPATSGTAQSLSAGDYVASETTQFGYQPGSWTGDCDAAGNVTLGVGDNKTCYINNNDIPPSLVLIKNVVNDNGGTAVAADWTLGTAGVTATQISGLGGAASDASFLAGSYTMSEIGPAGYAASAWSCTGAGTQVGNVITLGVGQSAICTIVNNDIPPSLTLVKTVTNNDGGTAVANNWTLSATNGPTPISGAGGATSDANFVAGTYDLSETSLAGYAAGDWGCVGGSQSGSQITIGIGQTATCTINNDDIAPTLKLVKMVDNGSNPGGTAAPDDWTLSAQAATPFDGRNFSNAGGSGTFVTVFANNGYDLAESANSAYQVKTNWYCDGGSLTGTTVTLALDTDVTCTIVNEALGMVELLKLTNRAQNQTMQWFFTLDGEGLSETDMSPPTTVDFGGAKLIPGEEYTLCETGIPGSWTLEWQVDTNGDGVPDMIIPHVPNTNYDPVDPQTGYSRVYDPNWVEYPGSYVNDTKCVNFIVDIGETLAFQIDNQFPGGDPRTIGYWKNWNTCTGGNQYVTADLNGGPDAGWYILDDLLNDPGYTIGLLHLSSADCENAVLILDKRDLGGRKRASDPAYNMAAQLLAAELNLSAGAETCQGVVNAVNDGQALLVDIEFDGTGGYLKGKKYQALGAEANDLAYTLDQYNNGNLCSP